MLFFFIYLYYDSYSKKCPLFCCNHHPGLMRPISAVWIWPLSLRLDIRRVNSDNHGDDCNESVNTKRRNKQRKSCAHKNHSSWRALLLRSLLVDLVTNYFIFSCKYFPLPPASSSHRFCRVQVCS